MKNILIFLTSIFISGFSYSQSPKESPLFVINGDSSCFKCYLLNPKTIESVVVLKKHEGIQKYGNAAENGVIEIQLKPHTKLIDLNKLRKKYWLKRNITFRDLYIDDEKIESNLWPFLKIDKSMVSSVTILDSIGIKSMKIKTKAIPPTPNSIRIRGAHLQTS